MSKIAIITARGGSKRIPRKNIKEFCGKPIISYSIEVALRSGLFDEVMVSTDDPEIADIARKYGADVPFFRSELTSNDYAVVSDVLMEVLKQYEKMGKSFDCFCCIYPTAPFVTGRKLLDAYEIFQTGNADTLFPVVQFSYPPQRGVTLSNNRVTLISPEHLNTRSQDLEPIYHDCGQFYFVRTDAFLKSGRVVMDYTNAIVFPETEVQDIDTEEDWKLAEIKYRMMERKD